MSEQTKELNGVVWVAAKNGDVDELVTALALHPNLIDTPNPQKRRRTPLSVAARKGHVRVVEKLIDLGSKAIDTSDNAGWTPLLQAAWNGHASVIETLVRLGSKAIDTPDDDDWTPMHWAAWNGHVPVIEALVRLGSKAVDTSDDHSFTPLFAAAERGHTNVIETLVRLGSNSINFPECWPPLKSAARCSDADCVKVMKALGAECSDFDGLSSVQAERLRTQVTEDEAAEVRFRVYFMHSLVDRLLFLLFNQ